LLQKLVITLAFCGEAFSESQGSSKSKDVKTNAIVSISHHVNVATPWVVLGGRPGAERIPFIHRLVFISIDEIDQHQEAESLQHVQSFKLARIHIGVHIHQKYHVGDRQILGKVFD